MAAFRQKSCEDRKEWIVPQRLVVVEVFLAQRNAEDPLDKQRSQLVRDPGRVMRVRDALGQARRQAQLAVHLPQQQPTGVGTQAVAVEVCDGFLPTRPSER